MNMHRCIWQWLPAVLLNLPIVGGTFAGLADGPKGIYVLSRMGSLNEIRDVDYVSGYSLRLQWNQLQTDSGQYDFSIIDQAINRLQAIDQKLTLEIFNLEMPLSVLAQIPTYERWNVKLGSKTIETSLPWSSTGIAAWRSFMNQLADHRVALADGTMVRLADHPTLETVDAPLVGMLSLRDQSNSLTQRSDYQREVFVQAVSQSVHASRDPFANKHGFLGFFLLSDNQMAYPLEQAVMDMLSQEFNQPGKPGLGFFQENLSDVGPSPQTLGKYLAMAKDDAYIMFQALTSWTQPFTGADKVTSGHPATGIRLAYENYGAAYVELYVSDIDNPALRDELTQWNQMFHDLPAPDTGACMGLMVSLVYATKRPCRQVSRTMKPLPS